jgi:tetratricopeptide (TPR) repeat protein
MDEWDEAIKRYEALRRYKDGDPLGHRILAWSYKCKGQLDKAREVLEWYLESIGENPIIRGDLGSVYLFEEDYEKAKVEIEKAYAQNPRAVEFFKYLFLLCIEDFVSAEELLMGFQSESIGLRSKIFVLQGKLRDAKESYESELTKLQAEVDAVGMALFSLGLADLLNKTGDFSKALSVCEAGLAKAREAGDLALECRGLYHRGVIQAYMGNFEEADRSAEELRRTVESGLAKKRFRYFEALLGVICLQKKDYAGAQDHLQKALSMTSVEDGRWFNQQSEFLDHLARAYIQTGQWSEAKKAYEDILSHKLRNIWNLTPAAYILARSYYQLGKVLERLGDNDGAITNYRKFLDLWKDADPSLPEVEDARKRLAGLQ